MFKKVNHKFKKVFNRPPDQVSSAGSDSSSTTSSVSRSMSPSPNKIIDHVPTVSNGIHKSYPFIHSRYKLDSSSKSPLISSPDKSRLNSGFDPSTRFKLTTSKANYAKVSQGHGLQTVVIRGSKYKLSRNKLVRSHSLNGSSIPAANGSLSSSLPSPSKLVSPLKIISPYKLSRSDLENVNSDAIESKSSQPQLSQSSTASHNSNSIDVGKKLLKKAVKSSLRLNQIKLKRNTSKTYSVDCIFYARFGRCNNQDTGECPYNHDPSKVAICTRFVNYVHGYVTAKLYLLSRFLKGKCRDPSSCLFSHKTSAEKTPVCKYFLSGNCSVENCNYKHVNVGHDAQICRDFVKYGSCPKFKVFPVQLAEFD